MLNVLLWDLSRFVPLKLTKMASWSQEDTKFVHQVLVGESLLFQIIKLQQHLLIQQHLMVYNNVIIYGYNTLSRRNVITLKNCIRKLATPKEILAIMKVKQSLEIKKS